jgi:hypothetical protein
MLEVLLKKEYDKWKANPANTNTQEFVSKLVTEKSANPGHAPQILQRKTWFK